MMCHREEKREIPRLTARFCKSNVDNFFNLDVNILCNGTQRYLNSADLL